MVQLTLPPSYMKHVKTPVTLFIPILGVDCLFTEMPLDEIFNILTVLTLRGPVICNECYEYASLSNLHDPG